MSSMPSLFKSQARGDEKDCMESVNICQVVFCWALPKKQLIRKQLENKNFIS